ncbi:hypothetical protein Hypma_008769 [Hypsizygus marmoreus]|uniref:Uncharacterized protein n=1 Tax=Hypsizygus marmoreus TaxID=39966 RepID=A0A369JU72_HYPMA|nr:hypothetical protein Hypma_008769 [Hypsizygus marmoreus]
MAAPNVLGSPTISAVSSTSSFIMLSTRSLSQGMTTSSEDSDDEIVYSVSESSLSSSSIYSSANEHLSDDDFVVLSRPKSPVPTGLSTPNDDSDGPRALTPVLTRLTSDLGKMDIQDTRRCSESQSPSPSSKENVAVAKGENGGGKFKKQQKKRTRARSSSDSRSAADSYPSPAPSPALSSKRAATPPSPSPKHIKEAVKPKGKKKRAPKAIGLGARPVVDDISERLSEFGEVAPTEPTMYEEAVRYITSFLSNPEARRNSACRLTLLQALIIELGLATSALPASLTAAKAFLKSRVFLNVREYLAVRGQGPAAVQRIMHPSRSSLIKDIRKKGKKAPLAWVKESGLQVLLVQCYH